MFTSPPRFPNLRPACPIDSLPEPLRSAALHVIGDKKAPSASALTDALAAAAAVVHCGFDCVAPDGERLPATINTCAVVPTAIGKGRSYKEFFKHFLNAKRVPAPSGLPDRKKTGQVSEPPAPRVETLISRAISYRALVEMLAGHGRNLTIQREDGSSLLKTELFKDNTDALTQLWSGDPPLDWFVYQTEVNAVDARGSLGFRIQPKPMYSYLAKSGDMDREIGLWPRAITGCYDPERFPDNPVYRAEPGKHNSKAFQDRISKLANQINARRSSGNLTRVAVELDVFAQAFMGELSFLLDEWKEGEYRDIMDAAGRAWENTLRIAVVFQVFCFGGGKVSADLVSSAWKIVEWSLSQYRLVFVEAMSGSAETEIVSTRASKPALPKTEKVARLPRPIQDANWVLDCVDRLCRPFQRQVPLDEVRSLTGLPEKRFANALAWLKLEVMVWTHETDQGTFISRRMF